MQTFTELREQALAFYKRLEEIRVFVPDTGYERTPYSEVKRIHENEFPNFPVKITDTFVIEGPLLGQEYGNWEYTSQMAEKSLPFVNDRSNRLKLIYWKALITAFGHDMENRPYGVGFNNHVVYARSVSEYGYDDNKETIAMFALRKIAEVRPDTETVKQAARYVDDWISRLNRLAAPASKSNEERGLGKVLSEGPTGGREFQILMEQQLAILMKQLPSNGLAARTWGFEIESPDCKGVEPLKGSGIDKGEDGSLRSYESNDDCECGCSDCVYHECDCDNCDQQNDDPQHCNDSDCSTAESAEFRSTGGIQRVIHNGMYALCEDLTNDEAEMNDSAGTHIHVFGADLTTKEVGQVLASYKRLEGLFKVLCGREDVQYARKIAVEHVRLAIKSNNPTLKADKPRAVNVSNLLNDRGTIEFRQMDCNYDANRITFYAWLVRGLVETATRGATLTSFFGVTDFYTLVTTLGKFNYFIANENPGRVIPGTKTDAPVIQRVTHRVAQTRWKGGDLEESLPIQKEENMHYDEYGNRIDEQTIMDETFKVLANDQELDEDILRESSKITGLVKEFVLDTGSTTWEDLVEACDEKFGTLESRIEEQERELEFLQRMNRLLIEGRNDEVEKAIKEREINNEA